MDNLGWRVSAKLARIWFASSEHIYNDNAKSIQPINNDSATLDWTLKFGSVRRKYDKLLSEDIYRDAAIVEAKTKILAKIKKTFSEDRQANLNINTTQFLSDIRHFHID